MKLLLIGLILTLINFANGQPKINAITQPQYGASSIITFDGDNFLTISSIKIGTSVCKLVSQTATQALCGPFSDKLTPATSKFIATLTFTTTATVTGDFKYATPQIQLYGIDYENHYFWFYGTNLAPSSNYKLAVTDTSTINLTPTPDSSASQMNFLLPISLTGGPCTFTVSDTLGFTYKTPLDTIVVSPTIQSISPSVWNATQSQVITITGIFFGNTVNVKVGGNTISNLAVTSAGAVFFDSPTGFISIKNVTIETSKQSVGTLSNAFTYNPPTISDITQVNEALEITAYDIGTDSKYIQIYINGNSTDFILSNNVIKVTVPPSINTGETNITVISDTQSVSSLFLVKPLLTNISAIPSIGGFVTIEGAFLNDCYFQIFYNESTLAKDLRDKDGNNLCDRSKKGDVVVCPTPVMPANTTFTIKAIRYTDNQNTTSVQKIAEIEGSVYFVETPSPSQTPSPTISQTPSPSQTPHSNSTDSSHDEDTPSNSNQLLPIYKFILLSFLLSFLLY
ncbi:hypothetical protein DICPUDRAFT_96959 [Dictyostelium purpureum]|uniref:IPT/TIG domain-containing protein n=1 Tax=Dictyostelium purpureum TaxID=5786 RepID=F0ZCN8_DICPU|nr:uncharacterized protein DICPUDRAFT_96959 [Dictyostelium purpureum]EGC38328.1 hypothetical protein DICPUDRAFT_96959 [Dictyostelium purpureum]|eukprot:XP_003285189.1 hypothetical protein DICPUDRAFT_96959 [Dictyostelium purpureum]